VQKGELMKCTISTRVSTEEREKSIATDKNKILKVKI
jgi:hypothetical protein